MTTVGTTVRFYHRAIAPVSITGTVEHLVSDEIKALEEEATKVVEAPVNFVKKLFSQPATEPVATPDPQVPEVPTLGPTEGPFAAIVVNTTEDAADLLVFYPDGVSEVVKGVKNVEHQQDTEADWYEV